MSDRDLTPAQENRARKACQRAIKKIGGPTKVAALFPPMTSQAVSQWDIVPLKRVTVVAQESGEPLEELAPDLFGPKAPARSTRQAVST